MAQTRSRFGQRWARLSALLALPLALQGNIGRATDFDARVLASHNRERTAAGVAPLQWSNELRASAARWGDHLARRGMLEHYPDNPSDLDPEGENLWAGTKGAWTPEEMVGLWISEKKHFRQGVFPANTRTGNLEDVGHYTQLMWRSSTHVGCALTRGERFDFLTCRYSEAGNVLGERPF